jgi:hypothetical protein
MLGMAAAAVLDPGGAEAQTVAGADDGAEALAAFGALVVGQWASDSSRHEFEWGVGNQVIKSTSHALDGDAWVVVSEGWWYWDPADETVRGTTVAVGMGIDLFEHRSRVHENEVVHDLVSYGDFGGVYVERWTFDADGYTWALEQDGERLMGGAYRRLR